MASPGSCSCCWVLLPLRISCWSLQIIPADSCNCWLVKCNLRPHTVINLGANNSPRLSVVSAIELATAAIKIYTLRPPGGTLIVGLASRCW
jgi:hypothetical protein